MNDDGANARESNTSSSPGKPRGRLVEDASRTAGNAVPLEQVKADPSFECPRFSRCAVNRCPLSPRYPQLASHPDDTEQKCRATKATRLKVAARYPGLLHYGGAYR